MSRAKRLLELIEQQGLGGPPVGDGGSEWCICPECGYKEKHERGTPCNQKKCPKCGATMVGERCK